MDYVPPAPIVDVLFEQLAYLLAHHSNARDCEKQCPRCHRLSLVSEVLMIPFIPHSS